MEEYKVILTWETIYDITDIADYIEADFGRERADRFQSDISKQLNNLRYMGKIFNATQLFYRSYAIHKKPFSPSIIFYIIKEPEKEIHILRVLRQECDWKKILAEHQDYTYPDEEQ